MHTASATDILVAATEIDERLLECLTDCRALIVRTFEEAQRALRKQLFRLIVVDLNFDNVRMFDLLHYVRMMPALSGVPVVCVQGAQPGAGLSAALDRLVRNLGARAFVDLRPHDAPGAFQRLSHMLQREVAPQLAHAALCVLIIDHDVSAAFRLGEIVEQAGHDVDLAYDARSGLDAARRLRPDAVFVELALPLLDGCHMARRLRAEPGTRDVLIVALTAPTPESDLQSLREAGFDHRLVKPAEPQLVRDLLGALAPMPVR